MTSTRTKFCIIWASSIALTLIFAKYHWDGCVSDNSMYERKAIVQESSLQEVSTKESKDNQYTESPKKTLRNLFYNRVGKCGSRSLLRVLASLSKANKFAFKSASDTGHLHPDTEAVKIEAGKIDRFKPPTFYNRHIHYIDFAEYGFQKPIYINMIRNPIDRFVSHYNYHKYGDMARTMKKLDPNLININECVTQEVGLCNNTKIIFYTGLHFCGMHPICLVKSKERVALAKKHLDEEYTFVGMLEEFETTLMLFEKILPEYFSGALETWNKNQNSKITTATKKRDVLTEESIVKLQTKILSEEFEVYNFAKEKFDRLKEKFGLI